ncbi:hypothetical protein TNCV_4568211 [Trichonephila clavipes]|nr:hypothetical protein TNCV_4568211 [Trichonephila clavipes]
MEKPGKSEILAPASPGYPLLRRESSQPGPHQSRRGLRKQALHMSREFRKRFRIEYLGQLREQTQQHQKSRPLTVGDVVVVENSLKNQTLWSLVGVIPLIPGKEGHVSRVQTETGHPSAITLQPGTARTRDSFTQGTE